MSWFDAARARARLIFRRNDAEWRMKQEFDFHIEMEIERLMREQHLDRAESRRRALAAFGGVERHKEELRAERGLAWMTGLSLDIRLGFRMLVKYPALTLVACLALSIAIAVSASYLEVVNDLVRPTLPEDRDRRVVRIHNWDVLRRETNAKAFNDYRVWASELHSLDLIGAFRVIERTLVTPRGQPEPVKGVEISASAFRLWTVAPLLGRTLSSTDEALASPNVVVIGEKLWRSRFGADSQLVGKTIRLGTTVFTVVGVMPERFAFPVNFALWIPFRLEGMNFPPGGGPRMGIFGRLKPEITTEQAQAELSAIGARATADNPATHANLRPRVKPFLDQLLTGDNEPTVVIMLYALNLFFVLLLCVCGANVATLVFARTATREGELTVRNALGASRGRIVAQLFCEGLALTSVSAVIGLLAAALLLRRLRAILERALGEDAPFWWNDNLSPQTIVYAALLSVVAAVVVGVIPALKATGQKIGERLKASASGNSSMRFGRLWTGIIVSQVAITVLFLLVIVSIGWPMKVGRYIPGSFSFSQQDLLTFNLQMDGGPESGDTTAASVGIIRQQYHAQYEALAQRLVSLGGVTQVTYASRLPSDEQARSRIELDGITSQQPGNNGVTGVRSANVGVSFFTTLNIRVVAGRAFVPSDTARSAVIVDQRFASRVLGNRNPAGVRIRNVRQTGRNSEQKVYGEWREIVGVVPELSPVQYESDENGVIYNAVPVEAAYPAYVIVRVAGAPQALVPQVRGVAAQVNASMRLYDVVPMTETGDSARLVFWSIMGLMAVIAAIALMLSTAGVHALMAFTVARRTREIGIRSALGADRRAIVWQTFSRAFIQVGSGIIVGAVPGALLVVLGPPEVAVGMGLTNGLASTLAVGAFVLCVAAVACAVPIRRALRIEPTEALRHAG